MATPFYFETEAQAKKALEIEGKRLKAIAIKVWREYLASYKPKVYAEHYGTKGARTGMSEQSILLNPVHRIDDNTWGIELTFRNDLAYHNSVMKGKKGHAVMLISSGWKVKKGRAKGVYRFGYYEGYDYIGKVIKEFNNGKNKGIELELQWSGKYLK